MEHFPYSVEPIVPSEAGMGEGFVSEIGVQFSLEP